MSKEGELGTLRSNKGSIWLPGQGRICSRRLSWNHKLVLLGFNAGMWLTYDGRMADKTSSRGYR